MKIFKIILFAVFTFLFLISSITILNFDNSDAFGNIATFLSITTGFTITALSIIATSNFATHLYRIEDEKDNSKTLLHILVGKFKRSTLLFVTTIGIILFYSFLDKKPCSWEIMNVKSYNFIFPDIIKGFVWYFTILSLYNFIQLLTLFSQFVIKSGSNNAPTK
jgi:hypothetical protein